MEDLERDIAAITNDRESGASEILRRTIDVLRRVSNRSPRERLAAARAVCRAQPGMAPVWNAAIAAIAAEGEPARFERFTQRVERGPAALARFAVEALLAGHDTSQPLSLVTLSRSASVERVIRELATRTAVNVACAEGRPALEGRGLAASLAQAGVRVTLFSDAAIAEGLPHSNGVVVGADAVAADWFTNKVGTRMLALAGVSVGVPVYVVAARDKFCAPALAPFIRTRDGQSREIWETPPAEVAVRNPYFERVPIDLLTGLITDAGLMPPDDVKAFCESLATAVPSALVAQLAAD
jgi:translation initiation factor 2B subunit (eIF-2B alpha/beta/delta family)